MHYGRGITLSLAIAATAGLAAAETPEIRGAKIDGYAETGTRHVYINGVTGERVYSSGEPGLQARGLGSGWTWSNDIADGCAPGGGGRGGLASIFAAVHDADAGQASPASPDAINYWQDWMEAPGDSIIESITFGYFTQILDPGEDGVSGQEFLLVFTESDRIDDRSNAAAHSPVIVGDLPGAEDDGEGATAGDGVIEFSEGNSWTITYDLAAGDVPTDIEIADTNGVSDGSFGSDSTFSGLPGVDLNGDGLYNVGYYFGFRQPGVAEGDGLIERFPELAGIGLENPDGLDPTTFPNIRPIGVPLAFPSSDPSSYEAGPSVWPQAAGYLPLPGEGIGSTDGFGFYDAVGTERGIFAFCQDAGCTGVGMACDPTATSSPYYLAPWASASISFNALTADDACNSADLDRPYGVLDMADIEVMIEGMLAGTDIADLNGDGITDLADIVAFIEAFESGCP